MAFELMLQKISCDILAPMPFIAHKMRSNGTYRKGRILSIQFSGRR